jgi:hypothetical protein
MTTSKRTFGFLPLSIRLETLGGVATPLVLRGTPLPAKRSESFSTAADKQVSVEVSLCMGESPLFRNNIGMGKFHLQGIPPAARGQPSIEVEFSVDTGCSVLARAGVKGAEASAEGAFHPPQELSDDFIAKSLADAESSRGADKAELLRVEATNRARNLIAKAEEQLGRGPNTKLSEAVAALGLALASEDSDGIRERSDVVEGLVSGLSAFAGSGFGDFFGTRTSAAYPRVRRPASVRRDAPSGQKLTAQVHTQLPGKIFGGTSFTLDPQLCFVLMPFDVKFQPLYDDHVKAVVSRSGLRCERADDIRGPTLITWDIWERINRARFLIADLTDQNPNVFYELGHAHALSKDVILITRSMDFVPFDLKTIRCIKYDFTPRGTQEFEKGLSETIAVLMKSA